MTFEDLEQLSIEVLSDEMSDPSSVMEKIAISKDKKERRAARREQQHAARAEERSSRLAQLRAEVEAKEKAAPAAAAVEHKPAAPAAPEVKHTPPAAAAAEHKPAAPAAAHKPAAASTTSSAGAATRSKIPEFARKHWKKGVGAAVGAGALYGAHKAYKHFSEKRASVDLEALAQEVLGWDD